MPSFVLVPIIFSASLIIPISSLTVVALLTPPLCLLPGFPPFILDNNCKSDCSKSPWHVPLLFPYWVLSTLPVMTHEATNRWWNRKQYCQAWWHTSLIPVPGRQRRKNLWDHGQPGLQSESQDSLGYTDKPCFNYKRKKSKKKPEPWEKGGKEGGEDGCLASQKCSCSPFQALGPGCSQISELLSDQLLSASPLGWLEPSPF